MSGIVGILKPHRADEDLVAMSPGVSLLSSLRKFPILAHVPSMLTLRSTLSTRPEELLA